MRTIPLSSLLAVLLALSTGCALAADRYHLERRVERTFPVSSGSDVTVEVMGGSVTTSTAPSDRVEITIVERIAAFSDRDADAMLAPYDVQITQQESEIRAVARRAGTAPRLPWRADRVQFSAIVAAPADVGLNLHTSGGSIVVQGPRTAPTRASTSGGTIRTDSGDFDLQTSGGSILVGQVTSTLRAKTSGGAIEVARVSDTAHDVDVQTSGGSIHIGVLPTASLQVLAETSGGGVHVTGLPIEYSSSSRSRLSGSLNGGRGELHARTSGGGITIAAAR